jgi:hypothetical protein
VRLKTTITNNPTGLIPEVNLLYIKA